MVELTDTYLSAGYVLRLKDKVFSIANEGRFEDLPQADGKTKQKFIIAVKLSDGKVIEWIPNQTSLKVLRKKFGDFTEKWIGKTAKFIIAKQNVRGEMKDIIFIE